jgi:hypothetical protein
VTTVAERTDSELLETTGTRFPRALGHWIAAHGDVLVALEALRRVGGEATPALEALLGLRLVQRTRLSWQLWAALVEGDGDEPEELLLDVLPVEVLDRARAALWGSPWDERSESEIGLRLVPSR